MIQTSVKKDKITHYNISKNDLPLTVKEVIQHWINDPDFRFFYNTILQNSDFESCFWEHPPITKLDMDQEYAFVLIQSNALQHVEAEINAFQSYFDTDKEVVAFPNLRGDAQLVVPTPTNDPKIYAHLTKFARHASPNQIDAFWRQVGLTYSNAIDRSKKWLSTAGLGVYWLHVRIDSRPKYYKYDLYKS
ncbi:MAG: hypothetical protein AAGD05_01210 [Bacteroidota bacterium]